MSKRKRPSKDQVKHNAEKGGRGGSDWFDLPEGVGRWNPEKEGRYSIDVLPYEVKSKHHPDDVEKDCLWYKFPFAVHHGIGVNNDSVVCPRSVNKPCCICDERDRLAKEDSDRNEDAIKALKPQKFVAYNIKSPEDEDRVDIFAMSRGKFAAALEQELKDPDNESHLAFFDVNEDGRTLRVRFAESSFEGKKFLEATKIDFKERDQMDEDKVLDKTVCLEESLVIMDNEDLKKMFLQEDDDDEEGEEKKPPKKEDDDDDDDEKKPPKKEDDDDDDDEKKPPKKEEPEELKCPQCEDEYDKEDAVHSDKLDKDFCSNKCRKKAEAAAEDDDEGEEKKPPKKEDDDEEGAEEKPKGKKCKACDGTGKSSKGKQCVPCGGTGRLKDDDDDDEKKPSKKDDDDEEGEEKKPKEKDAKGSPKCTHEGGKFGNVDQYDECDDCPHWTKCEEASE